MYEGDRYGSVAIGTLGSGDEVFIRWNTENGSDFDWELSVESLGAGDNCEFAATASLGVNNLPATTNSIYWYTYTMPSDGKLQITSLAYESIYVHASCSTEEYEYGYQNISLTTFSSGDEVLIKWETYSGGSFDWKLSVLPLEPGEGCIIATTASLGTNTTPSAPYWFEYTIPTTGDYTISSVGTTTDDTHLSIYSDCNRTSLGSNDDTEGTFQSTLTLSLEADQTIYILWDDNYSSAEFDWAITTEVETPAVQEITINPIADQLVDASPISVNATTTSGLPLTLSVSGPATISGHEITLNGTEGTVRVTASQAGDDYYAAASSSISFTVTDPSLQDQTITFEALPGKVMGDPAFDVTATTNSDLAITFTSSDETVATVSEQTVTIVGAGTTTITARQTGNNTYRAASASQVLTVSEQPGQTGTEDCASLTASIAEKADVTCSGAANGSLTVSATGGSAPYSYSIDGATFQEASTFTVLDSGSYVLTVKDANACTATVEVKITTPNALLVSGEANPSTQSKGSGSIALSVTGGKAPYIYAWSNNATAATISDLVLGEYNVIVTDASGCSATASFTVEGVTALEDDPRQQEVAVYPNPANYAVHIEVSVGSQVKSATLYTLLGKKVAQVNLALGMNRLDTQTMRPGSYLLKFDDGSSRRVVIR